MGAFVPRAPLYRGRLCTAGAFVLLMHAMHQRPRGLAPQLRSHGRDCQRQLPSSALAAGRARLTAPATLPRFGAYAPPQ